MRKHNGEHKGAIYWKNLGLVLLITCIPIAFIGVIIYYVGTDRIETEVTKAHQHQLDASIQQMNDYLANLEQAVVRLAFDRGMDETVRQLDFVQEFQTTNEIMKSFTMMKQSNSLISNVYLYLAGSDKIIGDEGFQTIRTEDDRSMLNALLQQERTIYWNYELPKLSQPESVNKAIVIKLPGGQVYGTYGVAVIYLDQARLNAMVQQQASGQGVSFLMNEHGDYLTTPPGGEQLSQAGLEDTLRGRIMEEVAQEEQFKLDWQSSSYNVAYSKINKLGGQWTFVSATPISQIVAPVTSLSTMILWISMLGLTMGLMLSWFASHKIYDPVRRLKLLFGPSRTSKSSDEITAIEQQWKLQLQTQEDLEGRLRQSIPVMRESFLLQFLQGHLYNHTEQELIQKLKQLDWDVEGKRFAMIIAQLHGISSLGEPFSERDAQLITFAASNIITELCSKEWSMFQVMNFQDLSLGVFLVLEREGPDEANAFKLTKLAHDYVATVNHTLRLKVTLVNSKLSDKLAEMPKHMEQSRKALRFRDLHASNQMLDMNRLSLRQPGQAAYPSEREREIVHAVSMGLEDEAIRLIGLFMVELQSHANAELMFHQGMMKLLGAIHEAMIKQEVNLVDIYGGVHLYEQLMQLSEPEQIAEWFRFRLIRPFVRTLSIAYDPNLKQMVDELMNRMEADVLRDVSLEAYADQFDISPSKLSKAFKQFHGVNFIDAMVRLRLEKCKELLVTTDMKINDIAQLLHYQPSYLIRLFKKSEGMTPRQYREKHA
ncbi:AraC family transcriptional regulator [Paenibacillus sp. 1P07SE]|uniref:AraC family transcriptional regulator n=1 Tax=Paenibacillus sp. 1P07SE TaxID=3132209 RepID=UPI0039A4EA2B